MEKITKYFKLLTVTIINLFLYVLITGLVTWPVIVSLTLYNYFWLFGYFISIVLIPFWYILWDKITDFFIFIWDF